MDDGSLLKIPEGFYTAILITLRVDPSEPLVPTCSDRGSQALGNPIDNAKGPPCLATCFLSTTKVDARPGWRRVTCPPQCWTTSSVAAGTWECAAGFYGSRGLVSSCSSLMGVSGPPARSCAVRPGSEPHDQQNTPNDC